HVDVGRGRLDLIPAVRVGALARVQPGEVTARKEPLDVAIRVCDVAGDGAGRSVRAGQTAVVDVGHAVGAVDATASRVIEIREDAAAILETDLLLLAPFGADVEVVTVVAEVADAPGGRNVTHGAVPMDRGAGVGGGRGAFVGLLEDDVDHARDGIG